MNRWAMLLAAASLCAISACGRGSDAPNRSFGVVDSIANSPLEAAQLFEASWDQHSLALLGGLLAEDFEFFAALCDTTGGTVLTLGRAEFLTTSRHVFATGTPMLSPATASPSTSMGASPFPTPARGRPIPGTPR